MYCHGPSFESASGSGPAPASQPRAASSGPPRHHCNRDRSLRRSGTQRRCSPPASFVRSPANPAAWTLSGNDDTALPTPSAQPSVHRYHGGRRISYFRATRPKLHLLLLALR
ncbi:hypothetical protein PBRA_003944 [Plasmodiophora brassicae]|uniref:Uncharacterized protein n=1 Tax=Plasmodiophora brassicae TaxID=37360 RepID=A0A0G4IJ00_PLABS|nr:hypothetical protein PBRA_003944 [Plasmodiophora brassicae]